MATAYDVEPWTDLFVASAGAGAALAGLAYLVRLRPGVGDQARYAAGREATMLLGTIPFVIGAISLLLEAGGGLYWIAVGILAAIAGGVTNAWVLLVEILR